MRLLPVFVILLFSFFFFITPPNSFAYNTNWIFYYGSYGGATAGEPYVACDINNRTNCECDTPGPVSVDMQACQDNLGSPQNVCCTGGSCDTGAERCGTIGTWDWCRATSCTAIPVGFGGCGFDFQYNYQSCGATDSCTSSPNWPYLNAGQCNTSGCTVGGVYKVCCDSDGTTDGTCVGGNFTGLCPSGSTTVMCGVSASTCSAVAPFPCSTEACGDPACTDVFPPPNVVDSASLACSGTSPPTLNATWSGNTENGCNIFVRAGVSDYQISTACSDNWSGSTLPGGTAVVAGGTYQLFAQDDTHTVDGGQATCPSAPSCTPICPTSPPTGLSDSCGASGTCGPSTSSVTLSWSPVTNADWYDVRVDDGQGGDSSDVVGSGGTPCPGNPGHDVCVNQWLGTSMTVTVQNNRSYTWWVHAGGSDGCSPPANCAQTSSSSDSFSIGNAPVITCPNGSCGAGETCSTCPQDCGTCPTTPSVSCSGSPNPAQTNSTVTWTANASGGLTPYTYTWSGTAITQATNTASPGNVSSFSKSYASAGTKTATIALRDALSQTASRDCAVTVQTPVSSGNCTLTANPSSGSPPLTTTITLSPNIFASRPADAQLSLNFGDGTTGSFNLNAQATHTYQNAGNYTATFTATSSQDPSYNYSCTTPIPPPPITVSSVPPPPPPVWSCSYVDPPDNAPTLTLDPDGKTLKVSYQYQSSQTPNVSFYRNSKLGFLPESGTLIGNQFGDQGVSFHRNPESSSYLYYQAQASNGAESSVSNTVGVATEPEEEGYSCGAPLFYNLANITGASQASSTANTMTFNLVYLVGITSLGGGGCNMQTGCQPTYTPPYLQLERSSGGGAYIPWDAAESRTHRCIQQNTGRWWYQRGTCVLSEWTATYVVGLPPGTSDTFTVTGYKDGQCSYKTANGSAAFGGGTSNGTPPQVLIPSLSGSAQKSPENYQYVSLSWPQTQDGQQVKVYMAEGWNGRWPVAGNPLPQLPRVFDSSNNRWTFTATDDLSQLAPGTYYYGNSLYDRGFCSTVLTGQASFVWTGDGISGTVFVDVDKDRVKDSGEAGYSGASVSVGGVGSTTTNASGFYSFPNLASGTYTVTLTPLTGYVATTDNPVTVSTIPTTVDFGIVESVSAWWQSRDGDLWTQADLNSPIPNACVTSPQCVEELSLAGSGGYPGVAVYGGTSASFGAGKVSGREWLAKSGYGGRRYDYAWFSGLAPLEVFTDSRSVITTSDIPGGELVSGYESGGYIWRYRDGDLTVNGTANLADRKVILIVSGKLTLGGRVTVEDGRGFFMAIARGDIKVDSGVSHPNQPALEGLFITDGVFSTGTKKPQEDNRFYIRGSIVAWGGVALERDLGEANNGTLAAEYIEYAPDLLFTFPRDLARQGMSWREVAP